MKRWEGLVFFRDMSCDDCLITLHSFRRSRVFPAFSYSFRRSRERPPSLQSQESYFRRKSIMHSFRRSRGRPPSLQAPESHFERIYFGVHSLFQPLENQHSANHAAHLACPERGRTYSAFCNYLIYKDVFLFCAPRSKFVQSRCNILPITCPKSRDCRYAAAL